MRHNHNEQAIGRAIMIPNDEECLTVSHVIHSRHKTVTTMTRMNTPRIEARFSF